MKFYFIIALCFGFSLLTGQNDNLYTKIATASEQFRDAILERTKNHDDLQKLDAKWTSIEANDTTRAYLLYNSF